MGAADPVRPAPVHYVLYRSPLRRPAAAAALILATTLLAGFAFYRLISSLSRVPARGLEVFLAAVALSFLLGLPAIAVLWYLDRRERESPWLFFGAIFWGMIVAAGLALFLNRLGEVELSRAIGHSGLGANLTTKQFELVTRYLAAVFVGPPVEETVKGLALFLLLWLMRAEFNGVRDGIVYGALVGLGFNFMETPFYIVNGYVETGVAPFAFQLIARFGLLGLSGHLVFTALTGAGLGLARQSATRRGTVLWPLAGLGGAIAFHMLHNAFGGVIFSILASTIGVTNPEAGPYFQVWLAAVLTLVVDSGLAYAALGFLLIWGGENDQRVIREQLAAEVGGAVSEAEYEEVLKEPLLGLRHIPGYPRRIARAIIEAQNKLAFRKLDLARQGADPDADELVLAWRHRIDQLRE